MNMFPNIRPFVSSLWHMTAELYSKHALYPKQPKTPRLNVYTKGLIPRAFGVLPQLWWHFGKARVQRRAKGTVRLEINKIK